MAVYDLCHQLLALEFLGEIAARLENNLKTLQRRYATVPPPPQKKKLQTEMALVSFFLQKGKFYPRGVKIAPTRWKYPKPTKFFLSFFKILQSICSFQYFVLIGFLLSRSSLKKRNFLNLVFDTFTFSPTPSGISAPPFTFYHLRREEELM